MKISISFKVLLLLVAMLFALGTVALSATAYHPDDEANDDEETQEEPSYSDEEGDGDTSRLQKMEQLLLLLQQLATILTKEVESRGIHVHDDSHAHEIEVEVDAHDHGSHEHDTDADAEETDELKIWIEVHDGTTHVHVDIPGEEFKTYFLDDVPYTDEAGVIAAIAERETLTAEEIEAVIVFPTEEAVDYAGTHIMGDGSIMTGEGVLLDDASINDDGMVVLSDGTVIEPAFDLR